MAGTKIDNIQFRRILARNVTLPLALSVLSAAVFVGLIAYLISALTWVERSQRVIGAANGASRLVADMESGMRGYLLSGDEGFLAPYLLAAPRIEAELQSLETLVAGDRMQGERVRRIANMQKQWQQYATEMIARHRQNEDVQNQVRALIR
jgi:CHASE3 domain sensor protein